MKLSWDEFNAALMAGNEAKAKQLLQAERRGRKRPTFIARAHARINKLRAQRERQELGVA